MTDRRPALPSSHVDEYVRALVDQAPPLSDETRSRLAVLLRPAPEAAAPQRQRAA